MKVQIRVKVGEDYWSNNPTGEAEAHIESEADITELPWEAICANLVQKAIREYEKDSSEADNA